MAVHTDDLVLVRWAVGLRQGRSLESNDGNPLGPPPCKE